jgi:xylulose-5-phosphate/fructose-6-phosphate phosphoketolase
MVYRFEPTVSSIIPATGEDSRSHPGPAKGPLSKEQLRRIDAYWRAANYLTIGQIYLTSNPLLKEPLSVEHIKPRLLGHWGTSPGLNLLYAHLNRMINQQDRDVIFLAGPGHGGPAVLANVYLEGTYSEVYPDVGEGLDGLRRLFRQFSTPGGVPSHVSVTTPGSINEGGELGYVLSHAFGAAFDNPNLVVAAVVGDGEAETGPLAASWKGTSFLNPIRDGAVLPILHLNGYKIANPTVFGRSSDRDIDAFLTAHRYSPSFVEGDDPEQVHQQLAAALDTAFETIHEIQNQARSAGAFEPPVWPAIVLRTPKGWTGPKIVDGLPVEGTFRAHQVPLGNVRSDPDQLNDLERWLRSYRPDELFDDGGRLQSDLADLAPAGDRRMGASPYANGGRRLVDLEIPPIDAYAYDVKHPATTYQGNTRPLGQLMRDIFRENAAAENFRLFCPDELASNRLDDVLEATDRCFVGPILAIDDHLSPDGRVLEVLSEHLCEGWLEGYTLTGRHGLFATYEAFAMVAASMVVQHAKWLQEAIELPWRAPVASLNILLTSTCWRNDHNGFSHQGPGLIDVMLSKRGTVARIYLPPDANCLLSIADHCLASRNYVNLIVIDKQPHLQYLSIEEAAAHCARGASRWDWASNDEDFEPDVVLAAAGDVPTMETLAAAAWLRERIPELKVRVVNVVDLMALFLPEAHPHGMDSTRFVELFTADKPVIFAFHGYQRAIHEIVHGREHAERFHVRGFTEQGTTTTPFDMVLMNGMSRFHLAIEALRRSERVRSRAQTLISELEHQITSSRAYAREHLEDAPEIRDWVWPFQDLEAPS